MKLDVQTFLSGSLAAVLARGLSSLFALIGNVLLARILGAHDYGVFAFSTVLIGLLSVISVSGLDTLTIKKVSVFHSNSKMGEMMYFFDWTQRKVMLVSFVSVLIAFLFNTLIYTYLISWTIFFLASFGVPILALIRLMRGRFQGIGKTSIGILFEWPFINLGLVLVALFLIAFPDLKSPDVVILGYLFVLASSLFISRVVFNYYIPNDDVIDHGFTNREELWNSSVVPLALLGVVTYVSSFGEVLIVGSLINPFDAGIYAVANRVSLILLLFFLPLQMVVAPKVSKAWSKGDLKKMQVLTVRTARQGIILTLPALSALIVFPDEILSVFGQEYTEANNVLRVLAFAQILPVLSGAGVFLLTMTGLEGDALKIMVISLASQIVVVVPMVMNYGLLGAAVGKAFGSFVFVVGLVFSVWRSRRILSLPVRVNNF